MLKIHCLALFVLLMQCDCAKRSSFSVHDGNTFNRKKTHEVKFIFLYTLNLRNTHTIHPHTCQLLMSLYCIVFEGTATDLEQQYSATDGGELGASATPALNPLRQLPVSELRHL